MTDLVRYENPTSSIELAGTAWPIAQQIARTEFVPAALRGKPEAVLACIMTGHELGIGAMQSLAKIHVIDGRPAMAAELMRAVILQHGHEFWIEESSSTRVTVGGMRAGSTRETKITWTLDDAKRAGLEGRKNWRSYPRAMLLARATAELARAMFADVLAGISYTVEELSDGEVFDPVDALTAGTEPTGDGAPPAAPVKKATAKKAATRKRAAAGPGPAAGSGPIPPLPGEEDLEARGDVDQPGEQDPEPGDRHTEHEANPLPGPAAIAVALKAKGIEDRDDKLRIVAEVLDHPVESTKDLEGWEVELVLRTIAACEPEELEQMAAPDAEVVEGGPAGETKVPGPRQDPPAPPRDDAAGSPSSWSDAAWRTFLSERGVKVTELLKEAQRLAREDGDQGPTTLEALTQCAPSLLELLMGYVEDLAAQRGAS